jgi:uncharacterized protein YndB with AHSA1/START domain
MGQRLTIDALVHSPVGRVWTYYTLPEHIVQWNHASDDWHCPRAENDVRPGGAFSFRMEAKDGSEGFDFAGTYDEVLPNAKIGYQFGGREASVTFLPEGENTRVSVAFEPENENPLEMQRAGWQAILDNFKKYVETR